MFYKFLLYPLSVCEKVTEADKRNLEPCALALRADELG